MNSRETLDWTLSRSEGEKRLFDSSFPLVTEGTFKQKGEQLVIEAEINGFPKGMMFLCVLLFASTR
jgi:hypothetical protein